MNTESIGKYRLGPELGCGRSGTVYRATDTATNTEVALKVMHDHLRKDPAAVEHFFAKLSEEERSRILQHATIASIGEATSAAIRKYGKEPDVVAKRPKSRKRSCFSRKCFG